MSKLVDLRELRFDMRKVQYEIAGLNQKIKLNPQRQDMKSIRLGKLDRLKAMNDQHGELIKHIKASPYSRLDLPELIDKLADIESQIVHGGTEEGHGAIRAFIEWLTEDAARLDGMEAK